MLLKDKIKQFLKDKGVLSLDKNELFITQKNGTEVIINELIEEFYTGHPGPLKPLNLIFNSIDACRAVLRFFHPDVDAQLTSCSYDAEADKTTIRGYSANIVGEKYILSKNFHKIMIYNDGKVHTVPRNFNPFKFVELLNSLGYAPSL